MAEFKATKYCYNKMFWLTPNPFFANILQNLYAGENGKIISFLQFSFQSFILLPYGEETGKIFEQIANEDLLHSKKLAEAIVMLGGKPEFKTSSGKFLGGRSICGETNIKSMILSDIELKENAIIETKTAISKINNKFLINLLNLIINENEYHINLLKNIKIN